VTHNEALRLLDAMVQLAVLDRTRMAPPASPNDGDWHIVASGASVRCHCRPYAPDLERGLVVAKGRAKLRKEVAELLTGASSELSPRVRILVEDLIDEWERLDARIKAFDAEFVAIARANPGMRRRSTVPGIGPINATALVAAVGDAQAFGKGRDLAAWLGLVPRQATTGGKPRLLGISKRGNRYLRKNLVHGARAVLPRLAERDSPIGHWLRELLARQHKNVVVVALANKLARICWAVLVGGHGFREPGKMR
jgi:transposase